MKTDYEEIAAELNRSFPKTPKRFQQIMSKEVCAQMNPKLNKTKKRKQKKFKVLLPIAACLVLAGSTVAASNLPVFQNWLNGLGINAQTAEESIIRSEESSGAIIMESIAELETTNINTQESPLFQVTDVYYDCSTLMFWARPQNDYFDLSDHVYQWH